MSKPFTTQIMGILNITPDSYSDGGLYLSSSDALERINSLIENQADIIDIGAQASSPKSQMIPAHVELDRLKNVLEDSEILDVLKTKIISVDTYRSEVARYAIKKGANIINDISGLRFDSKMAKIIADSDADIVIMHSKEPGEKPHATMQENNSSNIFCDIVKFFEERISYAISNGIEEKRIILDPGMGMFLSSVPEVSMDIVKKASELKRKFKDFRILYGVSRKSFIKNIYGGDKLEQKSKDIEINLIEQGIDIIRTHNPSLLIEVFKHLYVNKGTSNA